MYTIVCDIVKERMQKDFNEALKILGLFVSSIKFEDRIGLYVVVELSMNKDDDNSE
ncbi:MAG TPA: hypothetical protein GXZ22_02865 [Clostridiaceae bacterium]|nr:hypothetical protein [Clostridiaceae bacterium]